MEAAKRSVAEVMGSSWRQLLLGLKGRDGCSGATHHEVQPEPDLGVVACARSAGLGSADGPRFTR